MGWCAALTPSAIAVDVQHGQIDRSLGVGDAGGVGRRELAEEGRVVEEHQGTAGIASGSLGIKGAKQAKRRKWGGGVEDGLDDGVMRRKARQSIWFVFRGHSLVGMALQMARSALGVEIEQAGGRK